MDIKILFFWLCLSFITFFGLSSVNKIYFVKLNSEDIGVLGDDVRIISHISTELENDREYPQYLICTDENNVENIKSYSIVEDISLYKAIEDIMPNYSLYLTEIFGEDSYLELKNILNENGIEIKRTMPDDKSSDGSNVFSKIYKVYFYLNDKNAKEVIEKIKELPCILSLSNYKFTHEKGIIQAGGVFSSLEEDLLY